MNTPAQAVILATGERCLIIAMKVADELSKLGKEIDVVNARFVKPLDTEFLQNCNYAHMVTVEDNVFLGGFGSAVSSALNTMSKKCTIKNFAYRDEFITQGKIVDLQRKYGVSCEEIRAYLAEVVQ